MWRVQGFVGRALHRYHANNTSLRLPQNHHVEDEVINTSVVLSTTLHSSGSSSQRDDKGQRKKKWRTFPFGYSELRYMALDAVGLGAAAVLFMQICRRIHSLFSSGTEPSLSSGALTVCSLKNVKCKELLLFISQDAVHPGRGVLCLQNQDHSSVKNRNSSSNSGGDSSPQSSSEQVIEIPSSDHQRALIQDSPIPESLLSASCHLENDPNQDYTETKDAPDKDTLSDEENLAAAALNLRDVGESSIPVILNNIGLRAAKNGNYVEAFCCFLVAAQRGYSKAQFNTGVCYETGRGEQKDKEKALFYYQQAAAGGHVQAQYRYAKLLLTSKGHQSVEELNRAISHLEQASTAGLTQAQVCLASVYSQEVVRDECKSIQYLQMAAKSRDDTALLLLGQCYESGFGVQQNLTKAMEFYKEAAQAGNKHAKIILKPPNDTHMLRSICSLPCFSMHNRRLQQQPLSSLASGSSGPSCTLPLLPRSWSTGSMRDPLPLPSAHLHLYPLSTEGKTCQWTVGME
ncbi:death ligand signal enhancer isoform 2-T2 [Aulostomus maculatus]